MACEGQTRLVLLSLEHCLFSRRKRKKKLPLGTSSTEGGRTLMILKFPFHPYVINTMMDVTVKIAELLSVNVIQRRNISALLKEKKKKSEAPRRNQKKNLITGVRLKKSSVALDTDL